LLAHATAEQASVLIDAGNVDDALALLAEARSIGAQAPHLLRVWLAAAEGEGHAIAGHRDDALRAFDEADSLRPSTPSFRSCSSAAPISTGGAATRWRTSARRKRSPSSKD
jgi:ATP/maltotriose-dependent transcriptional regulator MalT